MEEKRFKILARTKQVISKKTETTTDLSLTADKIDIELNYLGVDGNVKARAVRIYLPEKPSATKMTMIMGVHYEIPEDDRVLYEYLHCGWTVLTSIQIPMEHLLNIVEDDLAFNIAVLGFVRRLDIIDAERIVLRGISAGGFQTYMLSALHLGINCAYVLCGIVNLAFLVNYIKQNHAINQAFEPQLTEEEKKSNDNYPLPNIRKVYHALLPTMEALGAEDLESETWVDYSPVSHLEEITHPVLLLHSTADILVPVNMLTGKVNNRDSRSDLPVGYECDMNKIVHNEKIDKPLEEFLPEGDMEIHVFTPSGEDPALEPMPFTADKRFCLTIVDEGALERTCDHFKDSSNFFKVSEMDFLNHYIAQSSAQTNSLTFEKMKILAKRFMGNLSILKMQKAFKVQCPDEIQGSLSSDRLDVLLGIQLFLGIKMRNSINQDPHKNKMHEIDYSLKNLNQFLSLYNQLDESMKFLEGEFPRDRISFGENPAEYLLAQIDRYGKKCGGAYSLD